MSTHRKCCCYWGSELSLPARYDDQYAGICEVHGLQRAISWEEEGKPGKGEELFQAECDVHSREEGHARREQGVIRYASIAVIGFVTFLLGTITFRNA